ncbi:ATP-binding cassette domain-containing protein [Ferrimonas sediminicola]|uniref:ATP-binding cassette domain-containing protein n=1 Tax=Ferrimonas sediminicola TaxID=2569538 RepID=A0A4U1BIU7_9GAMM|nr:ATP-binding cassette domain-containing protein [Ferrimonas sediminicola]TKB51062.1 ATP-binding cassette domain-containing protein [Ferrimonas sediminicola]
MLLSFDLHGHLGQFQFDAKCDLQMAGITGLFGPSGVGKTTLLRAIAGLNRTLEGRIELDGRVLQDSDRGIFLPPEQRRIGMVFQDSRLFPHLTVRGNLELAKRQARDKVIPLQKVIDGCGIRDLMDKPAPSLSAGQRQRVAIARALMAAPKILLLDEPLAALDFASRQHLMGFLNDSATPFPMVYISHSVSETLSLCDPLILMGPGCIDAVGPTDEVGQRLPKRRGHAEVTHYDPATRQLTLTLAEHAPELEAGQVVGLVSEPRWLRSGSTE